MNFDLLCLIGFSAIVLWGFWILNCIENAPGPTRADNEIDWWVPIEHWFGEDEDEL